ncbi:adenosylcobinamide amidohydrolase [Niallia sp. BSM11]|uniref:adenosylcobinamide amidohydrolase n=1 Tax=Niallia sp. BSM11 TaxID=3391576 RepID=UPI0039848775
MLEAKKLSFQYGEKKVLTDITFSVQKGEMLGILGPNGSGKTTLFKLISGIVIPNAGELFIKGRKVSEYKQKEFAQIVSTLSQQTAEAFSYTVEEIVSMGRYAHQKGWVQGLSREDKAVIHSAMEQTGISHYSNTLIGELSGGEKQRVYLAQCLAQEPEILLLDEPTNHLDLSFQKELLELLKEWSKKRGLTVVCIFHDLNLASLYCDRLLLLHNSEIEADSHPRNVLQEDKIKKVYGTDVIRAQHPQVPAANLVLSLRESSADLQEEVGEANLTLSKEYIAITTDIPLKSLSSGVTGAGIGWHKYFINRHVNKDYNCDDYKMEMNDYLVKNGFLPSETVAMMTAVELEDTVYRKYQAGATSLFFVVTASVGNPADAALSEQHSSLIVPGTINIWIFINGELSEQAFLQCAMTATETKASVLRNRQVTDPATGTPATGTPTDSLLVAATQKGKFHEFGGNITDLGKAVAKGVYEVMTMALDKRQNRKTALERGMK